MGGLPRFELGIVRNFDSSIFGVALGVVARRHLLVFGVLIVRSLLGERVVVGRSFIGRTLLVLLCGIIVPLRFLVKDAYEAVTGFFYMYGFYKITWDLSAWLITMYSGVEVVWIVPVTVYRNRIGYVGFLSIFLYN